MTDRETHPARAAARRANLARAVHAESHTLSRRKALMDHLGARRALLPDAAHEKHDQPQQSAAAG